MPDNSEIAPELDLPQQRSVSFFVDRDSEYRKRKREERKRKRGLLNACGIVQSSAADDEEEFTTAELKRTEKGQIVEPEKAESQSFLSKLIKRKNQVMIYFIRLPRIIL